MLAGTSRHQSRTGPCLTNTFWMSGLIDEFRGLHAQGFSFLRIVVHEYR
jgi:hypothetical protein